MPKTFLCVLLLLAGALHPATAQTPFANKLGIDLDGPNEGTRNRTFVDLGKGFRPFETNGKPTPTDERGNPLTDGRTVFFDIRPFPAWNPPIDDADKFQPDWHGVYHLSFHGQAKLAPLEGVALTISRQTYEAKTNVTNAEVTVPVGVGLCGLVFTDTRQAPQSAVNTGISDIHFIRPGYPAATKQVFTNEFLHAIAPFHVLRFMDWTDTDANPGYYGDTGHHVLSWKDRHTPADATQQNLGVKHGAAWEYAIALANQTNKEMWINIPVAASDDYIRQLALLLKRTLKPGLKVYMEHSNEVWNFSFPQYVYNKLAAIDEVSQGKSTLNNDGSKDQEIWAHRRHAKRLREISQIFASVYGAKAINTTICPVYASWTLYPDSYFADVLAWMDKTYGPPKTYFTALAHDSYFGGEAKEGESIDAILTTMRADSDRTRETLAKFAPVSTRYGLPQFAYEGGPEVGPDATTTDVANRIRAARDPRMTEILLHHLRDNWFGQGSGLFMYFASPGGYSRYGTFGISEDAADINSPKYKAIDALLKAKSR